MNRESHEKGVGSRGLGGNQQYFGGEFLVQFPQGLKPISMGGEVSPQPGAKHSAARAARQTPWPILEAVRPRLIVCSGKAP